MTVCLHYSVMFLRSKFRSYHLYPACVYIFKWISRNIHSSSVVMHLKVFEYMLTLFTKTLRLFYIRNKILSISSHAKYSIPSFTNYKIQTINIIPSLVYELQIAYFIFEHPFAMQTHTPIQNE